MGDWDVFVVDAVVAYLVVSGVDLMTEEINF